MESMPNPSFLQFRKQMRPLHNAMRHLQARRGLVYYIISKGFRVIEFGALLPIKISRNNQISQTQ